ncbi:MULTISPECIES: hypothetical protein [Streptomyces]|uniref:Integral membrane protein n=2 Tax=Streptomyces TaxID=1883 RepID=A0ABS4VEM9_9ACTN|nr:MULTISPECIES: hypothetical protein [Streptomyces]KQZ20485.1 hypothetical protein ASD51_23475 [Streptomyces sp. Root55]KQX89821.1 hypothetical protein ASD26_01340 [Streptomyces sp. Root1319]MBP2362367.1 hypothetical protein [Streptomyces clavifer]MDX2745430.1 hypothetical protein [Streptomyces sp. NRRL_B-2557]MDX3066658.1 hypothetical protein [Streptomyces sp. ND04-05B]
MSSWRTWHRPLVVFSASMAVMAVVGALGLLVDDRVVAGAPIWAKPFKFAVSFVPYTLTLAWMLTLLTRGRRAGWWAGTVVALACLGEMVLITGQVVRGKRSHFNYETPFDAMLYNAMAVTVVVLWAGTLAIAVLLLRSRIADRASAWAVRSGVLIALVGAGVGFLMSQPSAQQRAAGDLDGADVIGAHSVGVPDGGPSMPLTGWSTTGGDLRIPHFIGMHALQALPLFLLALILLAPRTDRLRDPRVRLRLVLVASGAYAAVVALVAWQALRGQPLVHPDGATLTAAALILAATAAGAFAALRPATSLTAADAFDKEPVS